MKQKVNRKDSGGPSKKGRRSSGKREKAKTERKENQVGKKGKGKWEGNKKQKGKRKEGKGRDDPFSFPFHSSLPFFPLCFPRHFPLPFFHSLPIPFFPPPSLLPFLIFFPNSLILFPNRGGEATLYTPGIRVNVVEAF